MGIYDRDYIRSRPASRQTGFSRGGAGGWRMWSVSTWLIVLCVGVFVVDGFTPKTWVQMSEPQLIEGVTQLPSGWQVQNPQKLASLPPQVVTEQLGVVDGAGQLIGWIEYQKVGLLTEYLHFSTSRGFLGFQWWRFIGFQFLHANVQHLLFNMIGLYFFGPLVERYLGKKRFLAFYLLCGIFGALSYLLLNLSGYVAAMFGVGAIPGLLFNDPLTPLVGASAGIFGVLLAGAFLAPNAKVLLFFVIPMPFKWLAYGLVAVSLYTLITGGHNAGGEAGHLGGAIAGFYFIRKPHHLHGFFDILGRADPTSHHYHKKGGGPNRSERLSNAKIDRILDKIREQGMQSLTAKERRLLQEASRHDE